MCSQESNWQYASIGSGDGFSPNRRQAITWTNADPVHWRIYAEGDELKSVFEYVFELLLIFGKLHNLQWNLRSQSIQRKHNSMTLRLHCLHSNPFWNIIYLLRFRNTSLCEAWHDQWKTPQRMRVHSTQTLLYSNCYYKMIILHVFIPIMW